MSADAILERAMRAARETFVDDGHVAQTVDPVFEGLRRNRVNAELLKAAIALGPERSATIGYDKPFLRRIVAGLLDAQKETGCWHEVHARYDEPSAMATAFIAEALLDARVAGVVPKGRKRTLDAALLKACEYVLAAERRPGFFLKSSRYQADHLNVDAACGAFLAKYGQAFGDDEAVGAARRAADHVVAEQFPDGAYPYTTADDGPPYPHPIHVPCIHYQGVTGYYLAKIYEAIGGDELRSSLVRGADWLASVQREDGRFDWRRSHMMFASCLSGAYAFAAAYFGFVARSDERFEGPRDRALAALGPLVPGLAWRWEPLPLRRFGRGMTEAFRSGLGGPFPMRHQALRFGHALYRVGTRVRSSQEAEDGMFRFLCKALRLPASTVEPSKNFPDLFMTSEIVDCVAHLDRPAVHEAEQIMEART